MEVLNFKNVTPEDINTIKSVTDRYPCYSDFNPLSLLTWNTNNDNSYAISNNNLIIKIKDYLSDNYCYSILGETDIDTFLEIIFNETEELKFVPELTVSKINKSYKIEEDRDSFDYIVNTLCLSGLKGNKLKSVRKNVKTFESNYINHTLRSLDLSNSVDAQLILDLNREWCEEKKFDQHKTDEDTSTIEKFIKLSQLFKTLALGLFINDKLIAFTLNELLNNNWSMGHFGKSISSYHKSSCYIEYATSLKLKEMGYEYINLQQDTGLPGLREAKNAYAPEFFLKKYTIKKL